MVAMEEVSDLVSLILKIVQGPRMVSRLDMPSRSYSQSLEEIVHGAVERTLELFQLHQQNHASDQHTTP